MAPFYSKLPNKAEMPEKRAFVAAGFSPASADLDSASATIMAGPSHPTKPRFAVTPAAPHMEFLGM
jgi:hypothetical protein